MQDIELKKHCKTLTKMQKDNLSIEDILMQFATQGLTYEEVIIVFDKFNEISPYTIT